MLLSNHDIKKIQKLGYEPKVFSEEHHGWLQLKNSPGRCVFHDGNKCTIYENRPEGCTLYPVVYEKDRKQAFLDDECPHKQSFSLSKTYQTQLNLLVLTLQKERAERKTTNKK
jgi:Fe-S-cluster containining protein